MNQAAHNVQESGIPNLDLILGGGLAVGDLLMVVGPPGSGKTTLVTQAAVHTAATGKKVIYVSTLSEPAARLLQHLRTFAFWREDLFGRSLFMESIYPLVKRGLREVVEALIATVKAHEARLLILDGYMTIRDLHPQALELRTFVNELSVALAPLGCTAIITSANANELQTGTSPELTMCDGIVELRQREQGTPLRTLRVWKMRGASVVLGEHALEITQAGMAVFPRFEALPLPPRSAAPGNRSTGSPALDEMMSGGLSPGSMTLVGGEAGTGKTLLGLSFLCEGAKRGETGIFLGFREAPEQLTEKARALGMPLDGFLKARTILIERYLPTVLEIDAFLEHFSKLVQSTNASRLVIDSVTEFEGGIQSGRKQALLVALTELLRVRGITTLLTRNEAVGSQHPSDETGMGSLAENLIHLSDSRVNGEYVRQIAVVRMRDRAHERSAREYTVGRTGFEVSGR